MTTETFTWSPKVETTGTVKFRVLSAQFGDGYKQTVADGINHRSGSWPLSFTGHALLIAPVKAFLDRQAGYKSFYWTPPLEVQGLYKASEYQYTPHGGGNYTLTVTFEETFQP
jgi:phage-related protein